MNQFQRFRSTPVIAKGTNYDGTWQADALAAPSVCWTGSQYVLTCSAWKSSASKWASLFFTSPDLETWTYVTGSRLGGSVYLLGNAGIAWWGSKYWFVYQNTGGGGVVTIDYSTDLLTWTNAGAAPAGLLALNDPAPVVSLSGSKLEIWGINGSRNPQMWDSPDGTTWTDQGEQMTQPGWTGAAGVTPWGEHHAFYYLGARYLLSDIGGTGGRLRAMFKSPNANTTWDTPVGSCFGPDPFTSWESAQVFDGSAIVADRSDGRGTAFWMVYAGGDNTSTTDDTNSSIGLAWMTAPSAPGSGKPASYYAMMRA